MAEEWGDRISDAIDEAKAESMGFARDRCYLKAPEWALDDCIRLQQDALDELDLWINNDESIYNRGPDSPEYRHAVQQAFKAAEGWADSAFRPEAEEELEELVEVRISETDPEKRKDQLAHEIADRLFAPFVEQFTEIPREERRRAKDVAMQAVERALDDFTTSLTQLWPSDGEDVRPRVRSKIARRRGPGPGWWHDRQRHAVAASKGWRRRRR